ncbi:MAG: AmmeMemoRadiSam system protein B [bacterium]|nr:AmmeMemoRadiSam system protein B [bacterium]
MSRLIFKSTIRPMAVAGQFYPADRAALERVIKTNLEAAPPVRASGTIKIIIVPHAGYDYSAGVAALAYKALAGQKIQRVYLLGNSHHDYFSGLAVDNHDFWETPLGRVAVDTEKVKELAAASPLLEINNAPHQSEHGLETQVPFLQTVLGSDFKIVPLLFGNTDDNDYEAVAKILAANLVDGDLIVVSSDMSHYPPYEAANKIDRQTLELIKNKDLTGLSEEAKAALSAQINEQTILCGLEAVKTALALAEQLNLEPQVLGYKNSGDTFLGDKNQVVGYGAVIFTSSDLNSAEQKILLNIARTSVENYVRNKKISEFEIKDERLKIPQGAFVTLKKNGELRGCIGQIIAINPLWQVVRDMAMAAAAEDNRFYPVAADELARLDYEISVLSRPRLISDWRQIRLGRDGVIVRKGLKSGVFLPQVASESGWTEEKFLSELCAQKAGLAPDCYKNDPEVELSVFQAQIFEGK